MLIGLWMEFKRDKQSEKEWFSDINEFRKGRHTSRRGEKWVIAGVVIEIIVAILFASHDVWDKYEIDKRAAENDPQKQPLSSIVATVRFQYKTNDVEPSPVANDWSTIMGTKSRKLQSMDKNTASLMLIVSNAFMTLSSESLPPLWQICDANGNPSGVFEQGIRFSWEPMSQEMVSETGEITNEPASIIAGQLSEFILTLPRLEYKSEIVTGSITIALNGPSFRKKLPIEPQWIDVSHRIEGGILPSGLHVFSTGTKVIEYTNMLDKPPK